MDVRGAGGGAAGVAKTIFILMINNILIQVCLGVRCYTDLDKTKSLSVECGLNTACVKIFKKSPGFDKDGQFVPQHLRGPDVTLFRGCFLVRIQDYCHESLSNRLTYCWCGDSDLCNKSIKISSQTQMLMIGVMVVI